MNPNGVTFSAALLEEHVTDIFVAFGISPDAARIAASDLVAADLEGVPSHGVMLLPMYAERLKAGSVAILDKGQVVTDGPSIAVIDAGDALGQLVARQAVDLALAKASATGAGIVAVRNAFHFGTAGRYARLMAEAGCVGIVASNTRPLMPAPGGAEALVGNNPIAIAAPADGDFLPEVDMALSASAMGRIRLAEAAGKAIPEGWAADAEGRPTTDASAAIRGMLLPAAGPKGFGLAFMIDLLCGGLSGGAMGAGVRPLYGNPAQPYGSSQLFMAISVASFGDPQDFRQRTGAEVARVAASKRAPGVTQVHPPGGLAHSARSASDGKVTLPPATIAGLKLAAASAGLSPTQIPF